MQVKNIYLAPNYNNTGFFIQASAVLDDGSKLEFQPVLPQEVIDAVFAATAKAAREKFSVGYTEAILVTGTLPKPVDKEAHTFDNDVPL